MIVSSHHPALLVGPGTGWLLVVATAAARAPCRFAYCASLARHHLARNKNEKTNNEEETTGDRRPKMRSSPLLFNVSVQSLMNFIPLPGRYAHMHYATTLLVPTIGRRLTPTKGQPSGINHYNMYSTTGQA
jgi:hypothetical protein